MNIKLLLCFLLPCALANAQDIILKTDQTEVSAKITEITTDEVKFKYANRLDGPVYTLKKAEVFVIIYKDGTREKFNQGASSASPVPLAPTYVNPPVPRSTQPAPEAVAPVYSAPAASEEKRRGWTASLGYTTPTPGMGNTSGFLYGSGYYFLGPGRKGGFVLDVDILDYFGEGAPTYGLLALNTVLRASPTSKFYVGGGVGYATVSVDVITYDRYNIKSTTKVSSGDFGGKAFMGYGLLRVGVVWPSLRRANTGGLLTVGLSLSPFN